MTTRPRAKGRTAREVFAAGEAARKGAGRPQAQPAPAPAAPAEPQPYDVINGRVYVPAGFIDPNPDAPRCPRHGTPMRVGRSHGEWVCGTGFGLDVEGRCDRPDPKEDYYRKRRA